MTNFNSFAASDMIRDANAKAAADVANMTAAFEAGHIERDYNNMPDWFMPNVRFVTRLSVWHARTIIEYLNAREWYNLPELNTNNSIPFWHNHINFLLD